MFPSPYGDYGSYRKKNVGDYKDTATFPSPYGDYGSYPMTNTFAIDVMSKEFPSPYGDYGSYLKKLSSGSSQSVILRVSVPLRGLWFLSAPFINGFMKPLK